MSARDEILAHVHAALLGAPEPPASLRTPAPGAPVSDETLARFVERVSDYRATVERCSPDEVEARINAALGSRSVVVPEDLGYDVPRATVDRHGEPLTAAQLDAISAVVTRATVGIAETGTIVLDHGHGQGRRAISLLPDLHVCIVETAQVVVDVPDAVARLDPARPQTWISGPSATSDIELSRVEGVHGPRNLHVLLVGS
ncbi:MAG TPA: lactate utilization protein C [Marmoricola sp.]|nr:lactate utilization protein C [Marmoricola sp.]